MSLNVAFLIRFYSLFCEKSYLSVQVHEHSALLSCSLSVWQTQGKWSSLSEVLLVVKYMGFTDCEPLWIESSQACFANTHHSNKHHANSVSEKQENQSDLGTWRQMTAITKALKMCVLCHSGASWVNMCHNSCSVTAVAFKRSCV